MISKKNSKIKKNKKIEIDITVNKLTYLQLSGIINASSKTELNFNSIDLYVSGIINIELKLKLEKLKLDNSSTGKLMFFGSANVFEIKNYGTGKIFAFELISNKIKINNNGIGVIEVSPTKELEIKSRGIGTIKYKGNPKVAKLDIKGLTLVKNVN